MVTIDANGQHIEAETMKDAQRLLRKAAKEAKAKEAQESADSDKAHSEARENAFEIIRRAVHVVDDKSSIYFRVFTDTDEGNYNPYASMRQHREDHYWLAHVETMLGSADMQLFHVRIMGAIENGAGHLLALYLADDNPNEKAYWAGLGACNGRWALEPIPHRFDAVIVEAHQQRLAAKAS